ncbi:tigger transposable element-derived protein 7-like [Portunus trituberculatus]|uniref:tigger transposable element-derived protein 7-like n=1 Tax=Portunus trituberculatus TaxID=210409 RepID=UPI001E1D0C97|nr:tigger transposable element-derived protein 7-like [Portunus trituberculatus]
MSLARTAWSLVVSKAKQPRCLRGHMNKLPVVYDHSAKAWFTVRIFKNWFFNNFVSQVIRYQTQVLKVNRDQVRALLLLDNAPAHPPSSELVADHGHIHVKFLPANTILLIQHMDQGIIVAFKHLYRTRFLEDMIVMIDAEEKNVGQLTLDNLKKYNRMSVVHNIAKAWGDISISTLASGWNTLLHGTDPVVYFEGFEADNFYCRLHETGEQVKPDDVQDWLDCDEGDPGMQVLTEQEIAETVLHSNGS